MKIVNIIRPRVTDKDLPLKKKNKHKNKKLSLKKSLEISMSEAVTFFHKKIPSVVELMSLGSEPHSA